jgi:hypothetical protein
MTIIISTTSRNCFCKFPNIHIDIRGFGCINPNVLNADPSLARRSPLAADFGGRGLESILYVIAQEIGHVMGQKHPQESDCAARLEWDDVEDGVDPYVGYRLMCDAHYVTNFNDPGMRLIKKEWYLIEEWLKGHVDPSVQP